MANIALIGALGVGMAHAVSAHTLGHKITAVMDIVDEAEIKRRFAEKEWVNAWGPFRDVAETGYTPEVFTDLDAMHTYLESNVPDLIILASPTDTHVEILDKMFDIPCKWLCEKPLAGSQVDAASTLEQKFGSQLDERLFVGYKWLYHPRVEEIMKRCKKAHERGMTIMIRDGHGYTIEEQWKADIGIIMDLGVHCLSFLLQIHNELLPNTQLKCIGQTKSHGKHQHNSITFAAGDEQTYHIETSYQSTIDTAGNVGEILIEDVSLDWIDLFAVQIEVVLAGNGLVNWSKGRTIDTLADEWKANA